MDAQLQEVIDKIKAEGIRTAEERRDEIVKSAEEDARRIRKTAEDEAARIVEEARAEAEKTREAGEAALQQVARDVVIGVLAEIDGVFRSLIDAAARDGLSGEKLEDVIVSVVSGWNVAEGAILLSDGDARKIEAGLLKKMSETLKTGIDIRPFPGITAGFRVSERGGTAYYDYTADGIADVLAERLSPQLEAILRSATRKS